MTRADSTAPGGLATDLELMRASALLESDPVAVARRASAILEQSPNHPAAGLLLASACRRLGDAAHAANLLQSLIQEHGRSPTVQLELGRAYAAAGLHSEAIAALQQAVALDGRFASAWRELAEERFLVGDTRGGDCAYAKYLQIAEPPRELNDAAQAIAERRIDLATAILQRRLRAMPEDVVALKLLANAARMADDFVAAEQYLMQSLQLAPGYAPARSDLANELSSQQRHDEALPHIERLLDTDPSNPNFVTLKAQSLRFFGRTAEAITLLEKAIVDNPQHAGLNLYYGHQLRDIGNQAGAIQAYRQALRIQPGMGEAYRSLADLKTMRFSQADIEAMEKQLELSAPTQSSRADIEFALGKALEDSGQFARSFDHYARGNALIRATIVHSPEVMRGGLRRSKTLYTPQFFAERSDWGSERTDPIFIVGIPRSGSTLLEQILASHSQVEGTRELPEVPAIARELMLRGNPYAEATYPQPVAALDRAQVQAYASRYLERTALHRGLGKPRFVDKMLINFDHIGLIHLMLPRAIIIDARRHPLGCCFSCFKQMFGRSQFFSYDQEELGRYYKDYGEMMEHIDTVLPGRVHRVHYEELVTAPERVIRRLLDHCGLPFEQQCLRFYENRRVVTTISSEQVRRPISAEAVDQWRHFEPWLGALKAELGELIETYPAFGPKLP